MEQPTQEQIEQMSPEEIKEAQKKQCIFCKIISGNVASKKIYEDEKCIAILDINPANPGHVLILPKEHYSIMPIIPENELSHFFKICRIISRAQIKALRADGTNIFIANGAAAGQKSPHFMIHLIPRKENDGLDTFLLPKNKISKEDQEKLRRAIKKKTDERFGIKEEQLMILEKPAPEIIDAEIEEESRNDEQDGQERKESGKKIDLDRISKLFR